MCFSGMFSEPHRRHVRSTCVEGYSQILTVGMLGLYVDFVLISLTGHYEELHDLTGHYLKLRFKETLFWIYNV